MLLSYLGLWNATSNLPTLADGTGTTGDSYMVLVDGGLFITNRNLGSGLKSFAAYSYIIYDGTTWNSSLNI